MQVNLADPYNELSQHLIWNCCNPLVGQSVDASCSTLAPGNFTFVAPISSADQGLEKRWSGVLSTMT